MTADAALLEFVRSRRDELVEFAGELRELGVRRVETAGETETLAAVDSLLDGLDDAGRARGRGEKAMGLFW